MSSEIFNYANHESLLIKLYSVMQEIHVDLVSSATALVSSKTPHCVEVHFGSLMMSSLQVKHFQGLEQSITFCQGDAMGSLMCL
jgi:hypothetical protein